MPPKPNLLSLVGIIIIGLALILGLYTTLGYLGWRSGQRLRAEQVVTEQTAEVARQTNFARDDIAQQNYRLALRRLAWVLAQEPGNETALALQAQAQAALNPNAAATATPRPAPSATPPLSGTVTTDDLLAQQLLQLRKLVNDEEWPSAIEEIARFQRAHPSYERLETDRLLFDAYVNYGLSLLPGEQVELGLFYLRQAEKLGDLPTEASDQRLWAVLYLDGISFYRVNWDASLFYFRELCLAAPFFHDACAKLEEGLLAQANFYAAQQDWCPAEPLYQEAYRLNSSSDTANKLAQARTGCLSATATPPLSGTLPITGTVPNTNTVPGPTP